MPRRKPVSEPSSAKKHKAAKVYKLPEKFANGEVLHDLCKKSWCIGNEVGQGGFGLIYLASEQESGNVGPNASYVAKVEPVGNGPLFCELSFYQRAGKPDMIDNWVKEHNLKYLGVPKYIARGQHEYKNVKYRFMVMQRFGTDLQKLFENANKKFSAQTVFALALRLLDALEYLHEHQYVHADIKASNCLLGYKGGKIDPDSVYLVDYGLAYKYSIDSDHKEYKEDPKKAHNGTIEFTSIDAHKGVVPSRRGDLEILGYCLLQWLCSKLPWEDKLEDKDYVATSKMQYMNDIPSLIKKCFPGHLPAGADEVQTYLTMVKKLGYDSQPNYSKMREIFKNGLNSLGVNDIWKLALPLMSAKKPASPKKITKRSINDTDFDESPSKKQSKLGYLEPTTSKDGCPATPKTGAPRITGTPKTGAPRTTGTPKTDVPRTTGTPKTGASRTTGTHKIGAPRTTGTPQTAVPKLTSKAISTSTGQKRALKSKSSRATKTVGDKALLGQRSPIVSPVRSSAVLKTTVEVSTTKKCKVVKKKNGQMSEMAVQTTPGLKKNA